MKLLPVIALSLSGFSVGWLMPNRPQESTVEPVRITKSQRTHSSTHQKRDDILSSLLHHDKFKELKRSGAKSHLDILTSLKDSNNYGSEDIEHIVKFGAANALQELLIDPSASSSLCQDIAQAWASQNAAEAISFFLNQSSYRADDCLAAILPVAFASKPELVIKAIQSRPRAWKLRHLEHLMTANYWLPNSPRLEQTPSADPFAEDNSRASNPMGPEILEAFLDTELKEKARSYLEQGAEPTPEPEPEGNDTAPRISWDDKLASYHSSDWESRSQLYDEWRKDKTLTLSKIVEHGNLEARQFAIRQLVDEVPREPKKWPEALKQLEEHIEALGVIPERPPVGYPAGPYLQGEVAAKWIEQQSPALQRSWIPSLMETWADGNPAEALTWALTLDQSQHRDLGIQKGLIIWVHQTPMKARKFVESLPPALCANHRSPTRQPPGPGSIPNLLARGFNLFPKVQVNNEHWNDFSSRKLLLSEPI